MRILALDLGKSKTVYCDYNSGDNEGSYGKIKTSPQDMHDLIIRYAPNRIVFEVCSIAGWVYDIATSLCSDVQVANPNHEGWRWKNVKHKSDRKDSLKLAQLSVMNQLPMVHIPTGQTRQKRAFIKYRKTISDRMVEMKNNIRSILDRQGHSMPAGKSGWTAAAIRQLRSYALPIDKCDMNNLWRGSLQLELDALAATEALLKQAEDKLNLMAETDKQIQLLKTIPGVGNRLAETVVAFLDDAGRFATGKQVGCYVGLTPKRYQSGDTDRQGRISGCGNNLLRALLVEVSWLGLRHNPRMLEIYQRAQRGSPSRKKIAIVAVARRLLIWCWAMLRDKRSWNKGNTRKEAA
jgi:transposase